MTAQRKPRPAPLLAIPPLAADATPKERETFRVEQQLALSAHRAGICLSGDGRVSSKDAARLIQPRRRDGDAALRKWRHEATGPLYTQPRKRGPVSYTLHALAVWLVEQQREPNA